MSNVLFYSSFVDSHSSYISNTTILVTRQAMYVKRNIEARSCNHCCSGKEIRIKYRECSFSHPARNAHAPWCHVWPALLCNIFSHVSYVTIFGKIKVIEHKMCVKYRVFWSDFNEYWIRSSLFENYTNRKFYENPFTGSRVVPLRTDLTKLVVAFRNFANARNKSSGYKIGCNWNSVY